MRTLSCTGELRALPCVVYRVKSCRRVTGKARRGHRDGFRELLVWVVNDVASPASTDSWSASLSFSCVSWVVFVCGAGASFPCSHAACDSFEGVTFDLARSPCVLKGTIAVSCSGTSGVFSVGQPTVLAREYKLGEHETRGRGGRATFVALRDEAG